MSSTYAPIAASDVRFRLLEYLQRHFGIDELSFLEEPVFFPDGWETNIYRFRLANHLGLPAAFTVPLILRFYCCDRGWPRLRHEYAVQHHMRRLSYPAPRPLLLEANSDWFGGPFMLMEAVDGQTMLEMLLGYFPVILWAPGRMAAAQVRLHTLPASGFPTPRMSFLDRQLGDLGKLIDEFGMSGLKPGLDWLEMHRPELQEPKSIVHLDFHPANLIFRESRCQAVLDWCESDVGDRHADLAASILLIDSTPLETSSIARRVAILAGRWPLRRRYLRAYRRALPIDKERLRYYLAWATLRRLGRWGTWLRESPLITGSKPSALRFLTPNLIGFLERYFQKQTGTAIHLQGFSTGRAFAPATRLPSAQSESGTRFFRSESRAQRNRGRSSSDGEVI